MNLKTVTGTLQSEAHGENRRKTNKQTETTELGDNFRQPNNHTIGIYEGEEKCSVWTKGEKK